MFGASGICNVVGLNFVYVFSLDGFEPIPTLINGFDAESVFGVEPKSSAEPAYMSIYCTGVDVSGQTPYPFQ